MVQKKKMTGSDLVFHCISYVIFSLLIFVCAYPFYYLLICTISNNKLVSLNKITFWPQGIHFQNYIDLIKLENLPRALINTLIRTALGTTLNVFCTAYMAYFFTKEQMWHRKFWYRLMVATMYFSAGMIPGYLNNKMLGLVNNFWVYIIPGLISVYNLILIKTFMESLPASLEEAALVDGAGYLNRFFRVVLPLSKPILATIALFCAVGHWNDFFTTKLYITSPRLYTLQFLLYEYLNQISAAQAAMTPEELQALDAASAQIASQNSIRMTLTAIATIPIMCVYPFVQKYYVKGIMIGAVKG